MLEREFMLACYLIQFNFEHDLWIFRWQFQPEELN